VYVSKLKTEKAKKRLRALKRLSRMRRTLGLGFGGKERSRQEGARETAHRRTPQKLLSETAIARNDGECHVEYEYLSVRQGCPNVTDYWQPKSRKLY